MKIKSKVRYLMGIKQPEQRTKEWFAMRENKITASSAASLLIKDEMTCRPYIDAFKLPETFIDKKTANPYSSKRDYILNKCGHKKFEASEAIYHGVMFEQVATDLYSRRQQKKVIEFGLLPHPTIDYIGASPDGITPDGIMLEIKCPFRRRITGVPPFYYWIQMQLQLEVANLKRCDYLECELIELKNKEIYDNVDIHKGEEKGIIIEMKPKGEKTRAKSQYFYPPVDINIDKEEELMKWYNNKMKILNKNNAGGYDFFPVYWKLVTYSVITVRRDKEWFNNILPVLKQGWEYILHYRIVGCESDGPLGILLKPKKELNILVLEDMNINKKSIHDELMILSDSD